MKRNNRWVWGLALGAAVASGGCSGARERAGYARGLVLEAHGRTIAGLPASYAGGPPGGRGAASGHASPAKSVTLTALQESRPDRYLIRNATLSIEVRDARQASRALIAAVGGARGYVSDTHESVDELGRRSAVITLRVPFGQFDRSLEQVE